VGRNSAAHQSTSSAPHQRQRYQPPKCIYTIENARNWVPPEDPLNWKGLPPCPKHGKQLTRCEDNRKPRNDNDPCPMWLTLDLYPEFLALIKEHPDHPEAWSDELGK